MAVSGAGETVRIPVGLPASGVEVDGADVDRLGGDILALREFARLNRLGEESLDEPAVSFLPPLGGLGIGR